MFLPMSCTSPLTVATRCGPRFCAARLLGPREWHQIRDRFFHHSRGLTTCGRNIFPAEQVPHDVHAVHERALDHCKRRWARKTRFLRIGFDMLVDAFHERVLEALRDGPGSPRGLFHLSFSESRGGRFRPAPTIAPRHRPRRFKITSSTASRESMGMLLVDRQLPRIHDAEVHPRLNPVMHEHRMHRGAHGLVAAEPKDTLLTPPLTCECGQR